jgi:2-polyprenyl-6-hydroxyphenyl methylase/3-demethylubiquinone-9 3-methyltransferase
MYSRLPQPLRPTFAVAVSLPEELKALARATLNGRPQDYVRAWTKYDPNRGMSHWYDIVDWVGGYPYEYAKPDAVFAFYKERGFALDKLKMGGGLGCSEYVFSRTASGRA